MCSSPSVQLQIKDLNTGEVLIYVIIFSAVLFRITRTEDDHAHEEEEEHTHDEEEEDSHAHNEEGAGQEV